MGAAAEAPPERMKRLMDESPLCHPGVFAYKYRDYDHHPPPHLRRIYGRVFRGLEGDDLKRFCELKPREHGKSAAGTVDVASWRALSDPSSRTLIMSEGSDLAEKKLDQVKTIVREVAPGFDVEVVSESNSKLELANDANHGDATVEAVGFGSKVTGGHFDLIIFDDLVDWPSQRTEARRDKIWNQFQNYLNLGSEGETVYVVLGTRKHPEDLYSNLIASGAWYVDVDRAISDWSLVEDGAYDLVTKNPDTGETGAYPADEAHEIGDDEAILRAEPRREVDVLWPERWSISDLLVDLHSGYGQNRGNLVWKRENQNDPEALTGQVLGEDMLHFDTEDGVPPLGDVRGRCSWHAGLDPAVEADAEKAATDDTDYWALSALAHDPDHDRTYVPSVKRRRGMTMSEGLDWVASQKHRMVSQVLVEDAQAQRWFVQEGNDRGLNLRRTSSSGSSKEDRIVQAASRFESGRIVLVGDPSDWQSFISEWAAFPTGQHDDRLDCVEVGYRDVGTASSRVSNYDMGDLPTM